MTYGNLKNLVRALLIGDSTLTKDNDEILVLLDYALDVVSKEADALKLITASTTDSRIVRMGPGKMWVRKPNLPSLDSDELDIDHDLCFPVARLMCSFVSREKMKIHEAAAMDLIRAYNQEVEKFLENEEASGSLDEYSDQDKYGSTEIA